MEQNTRLLVLDITPISGDPNAFSIPHIAADKVKCNYAVISGDGNSKEIVLTIALSILTGANELVNNSEDDIKKLENVAILDTNDSGEINLTLRNTQTFISKAETELNLSFILNAKSPAVGSKPPGTDPKTGVLIKAG